MLTIKQKFSGQVNFLTKQASMTNFCCDSNYFLRFSTLEKSPMPHYPKAVIHKNAVNCHLGIY